MNRYVSRRAKKKQMAEMNVVPYIDVMLVLLIIFMVTAPLLTTGVHVDLPKANAQPIESEQEQEPFILSVAANGDYFLNDSEVAVTASEEITRQAQAVLARNQNIPFLVRGDQDTPYQFVVEAMVLLQQAGVPSVGLVTQSPEN